MKQHRGEEGVSEVVGVMLLVGLTVLGVAIVAAIFLSSPQPDEIPHAAIAAGNTSGKLILAHEGGDPLRAGEYQIYIDTGSGLVERTGDFSEPEGGIWSIGESINYTGTETPRRVVVTVISGGSETILSEPAFVGGGAKFSPDPVEPGDTNGDDEPEESFVDFVINENVFVYGTTLSIGEGTGKGSVNVIGPGATIVITRGLEPEDLGGNGGISVSNIYINGSVSKDSGSASLGSEEAPGAIYINGDLVLLGGNRNIYGKVYVNGDCDLGGVIIHDDVYVNGDVTLRRNVISFVDGAHIYCTGNINLLPGVDSSTLDHCTDQTPFPGFTMPDQGIPSTKPAEWYTAKEYDQNGILTNNLRIFAPSYSSTSWRNTAENVIIIARTGDITITGMGSSGVTGIFFAPNGKVTFEGAFLEGVVIARDGFFIINGNTKVTFKNIDQYISNPADYPF